ncbi:MAG: hypothetical protein KC983_02620 [Phycisphaerales bacterium]|nr:hypothetical protein [Phycisphaerales bacterium]
MTLPFVIVCTHLIATVMMTGLIWFVQVVHYPLMSRVGTGGFIVYERDHMQRTTWVVAPLMLVELITALMLAAQPMVMTGAAWVSPVLAWTGMALVGVIWASTALLQVPCHRRLAQGFDPASWRRLVRTNWMRTAAWSARSCLALQMLIVMRG